MSTNKNPIKNRRLNVTYTNGVNSSKRILNKRGRNIFFSILIYSVLFFVISTIILGTVLYSKYIVGLPSIKELENLEIAETSIIYDRDGNELYKIFKEKRTYVPFEKINKNMINALVAIEDKRYWTNPGIDLMGLVRAGVNFIFGKSDSVKGTSTLTQQLIRNTIIENRTSSENIDIAIGRKVKEIYLAYQLTSNVSKEKIIELYLNKISYGNNAYGIEVAAKTYFNKSSKDLGIFESSILASLPKGPTYYSPYNHPDRLVGYPYIYGEGNKESEIKIITKKDIETNSEILKHLTDFIKNLKFSRLEGTEKTLVCNIDKKDFKNTIEIDKDGCSVMTYSDLIELLNNVKIKVNGSYIEYETGRKDRVLGRMLEDGYINFDEYKDSILKGIGYEFNKPKENIKYPHFVFYVKEYLEKKFGADIVSIGGLKIYTTLDPKLQDKAEELVSKQTEKNLKNFNADNAALISIDNSNGGILSMVGGKDYYDTENKGNVNIITSKLQPGSSFKPFVYALGIFKREIGSKTPIYDLETEFPGKYTPKNFDGGFMGKMNISTALNSSRNIPAIKMFYMAGGEKAIVEFMKKMGVESLNLDGKYGAPLALGTGEMTPLELATAYSIFANLGVKKEVTPILKIIDSKGNIIEDNSLKVEGKKVVSEDQSYIINSILSDTSTRPSGWNKYVSLKNRLVAAKTGTSTKQYTKNGKKYIFPNSLWTIGYTPQITTVVWAGNTDGSETNMKGDGLNAAGPIWRDFMEFAHKGKPAETWKKPAGVKSINISEISGLLPNPEFNNSYIIKSLFVNPPKTYDNSFKQLKVDLLCNGKVTEKTPEAAIKTVTLIQFTSIDPKNLKWQSAIDRWARSSGYAKKYGNFGELVTEVTQNECKRSGEKSDIIIKTTLNDNDVFYAGENYIEFAYKSSNPIVKIEVMIDDVIVDEVEVNNKKEGSYAGNIFIPASKTGKQAVIKLRAVDSEYFSDMVSKNILIMKGLNSLSKINLINPIDGSIKLYDTDFFNLKASIVNSSIQSINILIDGNVVESGLTDKNIVYEVNSDKTLVPGNYVITIELIDNNGEKTKEDIQLEVLKK